MSQIIQTSIGSILFLALFLAASAANALAADFDGDGKADFAVFRPSTNVWRMQSSETSFQAVRWGLAGDILVPADYDGDGKTDIAVWRPKRGTWHIFRSSDSAFMVIGWGLTTMHETGSIADVPVPADYDGDGRADIAVWRHDTGIWYVLKSSAGYDPGRATMHHWGLFGDVPVQADYDGDGRTDIAVFRPSENRWYWIESKTGHLAARTFGFAGDDRLVPADYTGDGKADIAVYRRGVWYFLNSETGEMEPFELGFHDSEPVPADYDGDGITDFAVYKKGVWYLYESGKPKFRTFNFGSEGDIPLGSLDAKRSIVALS